MTDQLTIEAEADRRHRLHESHPTHRPLSDGYELVGLKGEEEFARVFGGVVDLSSKPGGDGGQDAAVRLRTTRRFPVDVKTSRKPIHLPVEFGKVKTGTIYVLAAYSDATKRARLLGWATADDLLAAPVRELTEGIKSHAIHVADLRDIQELLDRRVLEAA